MYTNCRSLNNKFLEFEQLINAERIHLAAITEIWFKPGYELQLNGCHGFFCSREGYRGGGVALYLDRNMTSKHYLIESKSFNSINLLVVKLEFIKHTYICLLYRPPNSSIHDTELLCNYIKSFEGKNVILLGGFNLPGIDWSSHLASGHLNQPITTDFLVVIDDLFLYQHVTKPTRKILKPNGYTPSCSILDLIFTNNQFQISKLLLDLLLMDGTTMLSSSAITSQLQKDHRKAYIYITKLICY